MQALLPIHAVIVDCVACTTLQANLGCWNWATECEQHDCCGWMVSGQGVSGSVLLTVDIDTVELGKRNGGLTCTIGGLCGGRKRGAFPLHSS